ncbi:MAG: glycosyltransferase [Desulfobacterales bacterium]|nr:glycosyltransferase [Desulfobacterales bacterium]
MKVLLLSDPKSSHTFKWAKSLTLKGIDISIVGFRSPDKEIYNYVSSVYTLDYDESLFSKSSGSISKLKYINVLPKFLKIIKEFKPNIVHAHYATSYGFLGAISGCHPFIISVWGSDIFDFPKYSILHKKILEFNLSRADVITSTSSIMRIEALKYTKKNIYVIPFGINLNEFRQFPVKSPFKNDDIVIGVIKALEEIYGIEYLIKAFSLLCSRHKNLSLKLLIIGEGSLELHLKKMVIDLGVGENTFFLGSIPHKDIVFYHNMIDIFVCPSIMESFGVSVIEASACQKPVVVSNIGGLKEIVKHGVTGFKSSCRDVKSIMDSIERLVLDRKLRLKLGYSGRKMIEKFYDWDFNVNQMINIYKQF